MKNSKGHELASVVEIRPGISDTTPKDIPVTLIEGGASFAYEYCQRNDITLEELGTRIGIAVAVLDRYKPGQQLVTVDEDSLEVGVIELPFSWHKLESAPEAVQSFDNVTPIYPKRRNLFPWRR